MSCSELLEREKLIKIIAGQRPDLLSLLKEINAGESKGVLLDDFTFKKGQPIKIAGQADNAESLYKFQKNLLAQKNIKEVKIQSTSVDRKSKKVKFSMTFHYKNFTRKKSRSYI